MENKNKKRARRRAVDTVIHVVGLLSAAGIVILAVLHLLKIWPTANRVYLPLTALVMLIQAYEKRKRDRAVAILSLCVAIFIVVTCIFIL